jgi:hypothetical protein
MPICVQIKYIGIKRMLKVTSCRVEHFQTLNPTHMGGPGKVARYR